MGAIIFTRNSCLQSSQLPCILFHCILVQKLSIVSKYNLFLFPFFEILCMAAAYLFRFCVRSLLYRLANLQSQQQVSGLACSLVCHPANHTIGASAEEAGLVGNLRNWRNWLLGKLRLNSSWQIGGTASTRDTCDLISPVQILTAPEPRLNQVPHQLKQKQ